MSTIPTPKYAAYLLQPSNVGVQVHAFTTLAACERSFPTNRSLYELQAPESKLIAPVGSMESARAVLPGDAQRITRCGRSSLLKNAELWIH
jgi:hypothetical protein